jgi:hypothetical protein
MRFQPLPGADGPEGKVPLAAAAFNCPEFISGRDAGGACVTWGLGGLGWAGLGWAGLGWAGLS